MAVFVILTPLSVSAHYNWGADALIALVLSEFGLKFFVYSNEYLQIRCQMNEQELNDQVEANDFAGELSDEALDRQVNNTLGCGCGGFEACQ